MTNRNITGNIMFDEITDGEVLLEIDNINVTKSSGIFFINSMVLKVTFMAISPRLTKLFNLSLRVSKFSVSWAQSCITPIPKGGDRKSVGNWRPIGLVPLPGKLLEKLVHTRLYRVVSDLEFLSEKQFGFRPGRSTSQAIYKLHNDLAVSMNAGNITGLIYIDISKAFDSIHHMRLLNKLSMLGLHLDLVNWFNTYLTRTHSTFFNNTTSTKLPVTSGVPQGSVLGPLLFIIYINDMCDILTNCNMLLYADDCVIYNSHRNFETVSNNLQCDLDRLITWYSVNLMKVNIGKTKSMLVGTRQKIRNTPELQLKISDTLLSNVQCYNYLGISTDCELSFNNYLNNLGNRVHRKIFQLSKIRKYITEFAAFQIYKQTIMPIIDYCNFLIMSGNKSDYQDLQILQNNALRICVGYPNGYQLSRVELHTKAKLSGVLQRADMNLLSIMYDESLKESKIVEPLRETRQTTKIVFKQNRLNNKKYIKSPYIRGICLWDKLNQETQKLPTKTEFNRRILPLFKKYDQNYGMEPNQP